MKKNSANRKAFTLIEVLMSIMLMGILTTVSLTAIEGISNDVAFEKTYKKLLDIRNALVGDFDTNKQGMREYFGYLGDIGGLPTTLQGGITALIDRPGDVAAWNYDATARIGIGWRGPYLKATTGVNWLKDTWGSDIIYSPDTDPPYIMSYGSDKVEDVGPTTGTASDIRIDLPESVTHATVFGVINRNSVIYSNSAEVHLYHPDGLGNLTTKTYNVAPSSYGYFTFSDVPFGLRSFNVFFPSAVSPADTIGPAFIPVDNIRYQVPHNFLDSAPGDMPHLCANINNYSFVPGSMVKSTTLKRIYFELNITESMRITTLYLLTPVEDAELVRVRIGTVTMDCGPALRCKVRSGNDLDDDTTLHELRHAPEISLESEVHIEVGDNVGSYVEFSDANDVTDMDNFALRLGCRIVTIQ